MESLESSVEKISSYMAPICAGIPHEAGKGITWTVWELQEKTGVNGRIIGKLRNRFTKAWGQALTPGKPPEFTVRPQSVYGKAGIVVERIAEAPHA